MEIIDLDKTIESTIFDRTLGGSGGQNSRGEYRNNRHNNYNRSRDRSRERTFSRNYGNNRNRSSSNSRSGSRFRASTKKKDKLTVMMSRLAAKDSNKKRPFKPQMSKSRLDATLVGNMTILQEIVPTLQKRET